MNLRPEVQAFAEAMERRLQANDHKPGWKHDTVLSLQVRLDEEVAELDEAVHGTATKERILDEAADVANFAMMIADRWDTLTR